MNTDNPRDLRARLLDQLDDTTDAMIAAARINAEHADAKRAYDAAVLACEHAAACATGPEYSNEVKRKFQARLMLDTRFPGVREHYEATARRKADADALVEVRQTALKTLRAVAGLYAAELEAQATAESVAKVTPFIRVGSR
jgi:hypothetical protein